MKGKRSVLSIAISGAMVSGIVITTAACGARGPLDTPDYFFANTDASDEASTAEGGSTDGASDAIALTDARANDSGVDAANPINCAVCVGQSCSNQIIACVTSQSCLGTLNCVFSKCLSGGSVNPVCAFGCAGEGGPTGLLDVLAVFQCITMSCGADCNSLIGGLGGGLGGKMSSGNAGMLPAPADAPARIDDRATHPDQSPAAVRRAAREAFASFPEMCNAIPTDGIR